MTKSEIAVAILAALNTAGITPARTQYDDSGSLVSVYPEIPFPGRCDGDEQLVAIYADQVRGWVRRPPFNYSRGSAHGAPIPYSTVDEMIAAVKKLRGVKAACWT